MSKMFDGVINHHPMGRTSMDTSPRKLFRSLALMTTLSLAAVACGSAEAAVDDDSSAVTATSAAAVSVSVDGDFYDSSVVHDIEVDFDADQLDEIIAAYLATGDKDWMEVAVTIDGEDYQSVGMRLKGNSSLFSLTAASAAHPEDLPWLIRFDKYIDDQSHQGYNDIVIRSNSTETSLNEAVAAELLDAAGLASQQAVSTTLSFNGGEVELRLAMQNPDEVWEAANFDSDESALYKADSTGDYSYRGDDVEAYDEVFDQKVGDDDLEPLIDFLEFINTTDDETFSSDLDQWLDTEAFATYLAFQELIGNADDIDGRGNNSYLQYDYGTGIFTVVNWDLNLAFGTANVAGGVPGGGVPGGGAPGGGTPPAGARPERGAGGPAAGGGAAEGNNVLSSRFLADDEFAQMYADATAELLVALFDSGLAADVVARWSDTLEDQAVGVVDTATISADAAAILAAIPSA